MKLRPKGWDKFQHYKDRCPPWIKLHRDLLTSREFMSLPTASKALAPMLWLLASESKDGVLDASFEELQFRLHISQKDYQDGLKSLIDKGFFESADGMLATCLQDAIPERETEKRERQISLSESVPTVPYNELIDLYEKHLPGLPSVRKSLFSTGPNAKATKQRWDWVMTSCHEKGQRVGQRLAETPEQALEWFDKFFGFVSQSEFLTGKDQKWTGCNLGWLMNRSNFEKVLSGQYHKKD